MIKSVLRRLTKTSSVGLLFIVAFSVFFLHTATARWRGWDTYADWYIDDSRICTNGAVFGYVHRETASWRQNEEDVDVRFILGTCTTNAEGRCIGPIKTSKTVTAHLPFANQSAGCNTDEDGQLHYCVNPVRVYWDQPAVIGDMFFGTATIISKDGEEEGGGFPFPTPDDPEVPVVASCAFPIAYHTNTAPTIDGNLSEWPDIDALEINSATGNTVVGYPASQYNISAELRSLWTNTHLYFAVSVIDDEIITDGPNVWDDDEIEIGIDGLDNGPSNTDDHQFTVNPDGRETDSGFPGGFEVKTRIRIDGWDAEFAIPKAHLRSGDLVAGKVMGFNPGIRDDDDGGQRDTRIVWVGSTTEAPEATWGTLRLLPDQASLVPPTAPVLSGGTITFQAGKFDYEGVRDAFISEWEPTTNFGQRSSISLRSDETADGVRAGLLQFDLSELPNGTAIQSAWLSMWPFLRTNANQMLIEVHAVKRSWSKTEATWLQARNGHSWHLPGASGSNDIGAVQAEYLINEIEQWQSIDLTNLVQDWVDGSVINEGLILRAVTAEGQKPQGRVAYDFISSNANAPEFLTRRPELIVSYWQPTIYLPMQMTGVSQH